jgi:hypothetical protein
VATNEIGIQMDVAGTYSAPWFQHPSPGSTTKSHFSMPLSQLPSAQGNSLGKSDTDHSGLPAFAVFSFQSATCLQQLQIHMDRYALMQSTGLGWAS